MGLVSECVEQGDRPQRDQPIATEKSDLWHRSQMVAELTQAAVQRLHISAMGCQAMVDHSRAKVTTSRTLLDSLRRDG